MLNPLIRILVQQQPTLKYPNRNNYILFDYVANCEISNSVQNMTQTAKFTLPVKNAKYAIFYNEQDINTDTKTTNNGAKITVLPGTRITKSTNLRKEVLNLKNNLVSGTIVDPLFIRGDKIKIVVGYNTTKDYIQDIQKLDADNQTTNEVYCAFEGFITKISYKVPLEIECEDYMFVLKQVNIPNLKSILGNSYNETKGYDTSAKGKSLEQLLNLILNNTEYSSYVKSDGTKINATSLSDIFEIRVDNTRTSIGAFILYSTNTIAQFLDEIKSKFHFTIYIKRTFENDKVKRTLHCGLIRYYPLVNGQEKENHNIYFQRNIIDDDLNYNREDDIRIRLVAFGFTRQELVEENIDKTKKRKKYRIQEIVGDPDGETRTIYFYPPSSDQQTNAIFGEWTDAKISTEKSLVDTNTILYRSGKLRGLAEAMLPKLKKTNASGSITTFGLPELHPGDYIKLNDKIFTERDGNVFIIKSVITNFGTNGFKRKIELDYRIDSLTETQKQSLNLNGL